MMCKFTLFPVHLQAFGVKKCFWLIDVGQKETAFCRIRH